LAGRAYYWRTLPAGWRIFSGGLVEILRARGGFVPIYALDDEFGTLKFLAQELQVRADSIRFQKAA